MSRKIWAIITALSTGSPFASAQEGAALHCENLNPDVAFDVPRAFECVSKLDADLRSAINRISQLETSLGSLSDLKDLAENTVPAIGNHPETKAIVSFFSEKGEKTCPPGWSPYSSAKNRFIVGAGDEYAVVGRTGGEETVSIHADHLPNMKLEALGKTALPILGSISSKIFDRGNTLSGTASLDANTDSFRFATGAAVPASANSVHSTNFTFTDSGSDVKSEVNWPGKSVEQSNIPPYIALYFCKKD